MSVPPESTDSPRGAPISSRWVRYTVGIQRQPQEPLCSLPVHQLPAQLYLPAQWGAGSPGRCLASQQTSGLVSWLAEATFVAVSPQSGRAEVDDVLAAIRPTTCLVSIMLANNETGVIMVRLHDRVEGTNGTRWGHPHKKVLGKGEPTVPGTQVLFPPASL